MEYQIKRSDRRTMALEITKDGTVLVRAPRRMPEREIQRFVEEKADWITVHLQKRQQILEKRQQEAQPKLTAAELHRLAEDALVIIPQRVAYFAGQMGVTYGRITIRNQKSRWGSCSSAGNLNFNCLLMLAPPEVRDYVVVHELCHRIEMNHSDRFWREVARVMPDYQRHRAWLKQNGSRLIDRMVR